MPRYRWRSPSFVSKPLFSKNTLCIPLLLLYFTVGEDGKRNSPTAPQSSVLPLLLYCRYYGTVLTVVYFGSTMAFPFHHDSDEDTNDAPMEIGGPTDFKVISHIGIDGLNNVPPNWLPHLAAVGCVTWSWCLPTSSILARAIIVFVAFCRYIPIFLAKETRR